MPDGFTWIPSGTGGWGLGSFLRWWPPSAMWAGPFNLFMATTGDVWIIPSFSNLGLCAACWALFMCHHELWPTSVSCPFPFLNTVRPKKYAHGFVVLAAWLGLAACDAGCSVLVQMQWFSSPCGGHSHYKLWSWPPEQGSKLEKLLPYCDVFLMYIRCFCEKYIPTFALVDFIGIMIHVHSIKIWESWPLPMKHIVVKVTLWIVVVISNTYRRFRK